MDRRHEILDGAKQFRKRDKKKKKMKDKALESNDVNHGNQEATSSIKSIPLAKEAVMNISPTAGTEMAHSELSFPLEESKRRKKSRESAVESTDMNSDRHADASSVETTALLTDAVIDINPKNGSEMVHLGLELSCQPDKRKQKRKRQVKTMENNGTTNDMNCGCQEDTSSVKTTPLVTDTLVDISPKLESQMPHLVSCNGTLPPGSTGLPLIGETLELIIPSNSFDVPPFIKKRLQRYGPIFRTNVAGRGVVVSADPEFNHFIFQQEGRAVESWYLDLFAKIFKQGENRPDGAYVHKYVRNLTLSHFGVESLKGKLLPQLEQLIRASLSTWSRQDFIDVKDAVATIAFTSATRELYSYDPERFSRDLREKYINFARGLLSFPVNIPGTTYHRCLKDQKEALKVVSDVVKARLASPETHKGDVLDQILEDMKTEKFLTEEFVVQLLFGLSFVSFDSVSWAATVLIKLLDDNPLVLEELIAEHEAILKRRQNSNSSITWEEYKMMTFTLQVINETLRLGTTTPGLLRRARKDIQLNGYTIPKGWAIMVVSSAMQLNPNVYDDPLTFNPWRWKDLEPSVISKNFMPFGSGMKQCAGSEYSRVFLSVFIHVLVTKHRWTKIRGGDPVRNPMLRFKSGLRVKFFEKNN